MNMVPAEAPEAFHLPDTDIGNGYQRRHTLLHNGDHVAARYSGPFYQDNIGSASSRSTIGEVKVKEKKKSFPRLMMKVICVALVYDK